MQTEPPCGKEQSVEDSWVFRPISWPSDSLFWLATSAQDVLAATSEAWTQLATRPLVQM